MRRPLRTTLGVGVSAALAAVLTLPVAAAPSQASTQPARVQDFLAAQLGKLGPLGQATVLVHGTDLTAAKRAVGASGLTTATTFARIGVVDTLAKAYLPFASGLAVYVLMAAVLLWRPTGLFARAA